VYKYHEAKRDSNKRTSVAMASHVVVIDTSFRRTTIKVTPGKHVSDILEEACVKFGLNASNYGLK
jgi:tether containing UBX domain for GLUT4